MQIEIINFPVALRLGYYEHERHVEQQLKFHIVLETKDFEFEAIDDKLNATINYEFIFKGVAEWLQGREIHLIETAVQIVGRNILACEPRITAVTVSAEKSALPYALARNASVRITRRFHREAGTGVVQ